MGRRIVDLSVPCTSETEGMTVKLQDDLPLYFGHECYAYDLRIKSHTGTYLEGSAHLYRDGKNTDEIPLDKLILPGVCVSVSHNRRYVDADDLEAACPSPPTAWGLLVNTGGTDKFFSRDAAMWMAKHKVALMGSNTPLYDGDPRSPSGFFVDLFKAEIPIIANVINLDLLPFSGFTLIVLPIRIPRICTVPARVIAVIE